MVFVIAGNVESDRNIVGRLLADNLGWEFVDGENLHPHDFGARNRNAVPNADPSFRMETLSAAINGWIYRWQDVVVSCPMLTETDRRRLSEISSLVKIVYSEPSHTTGAPPLLDRDCLEHMVGCEFADGGRAKHEPEQQGLTVELSRQVEEIIREMVSSSK